MVAKTGEAALKQNGSKQTVSHDDLVELVCDATRAPSGHNTQPWLFRLGNSSIDVIADRTRALPVVDPFDRELIISCGAALRFLEIGARRKGFCAAVSLLPKGPSDDTIGVAELHVGDPPSTFETTLFDAMEARRTNRNAFENDPVPPEIQAECVKLAANFGVECLWLSSPKQRRDAAKLVSEGDHLQFDDPRFRRELASWIHSYRLGSKDGMSGAAFDMPDLLAPAARFAIRTFDLGDSVGAANAEKIENGSPSLLTLGTLADDPAQWVNTGRALADTLLFLTSEGYAHSYLNQPIETETLRPQLKRLLGTNRLPQLLLRIGRAQKNVRPSMRRDVSSVILNSQP